MWIYDTDKLFVIEEKKKVAPSVWLSSYANYATDAAKVCQQPATATGVNTAVTTYTYDDFCRLTLTAVTGGAWVRTSYADDGNPNLQRIVTTTPLPGHTPEDPTMTESSVYYDGLGRTYRTKSLGELRRGQAADQDQGCGRRGVGLQLRPGRQPHGGQ